MENLHEFEKAYEFWHERVEVYSDYPPLPPQPSLTAEEIVQQTEKDLVEMEKTPLMSTTTFYARREIEARKKLTKFYYAVWTRYKHRLLKTDHLPDEQEISAALLDVKKRLYS